MGVFAPGHLGELTQYLPFELDRRHARKRADSYGCVKGPAGCGGPAIKAGLLAEYVTGAVLDALESPRVQEELREGEDQHGPRRAELLEQIRDAQERREEGRRDYSDRVIDRADWLDIRQRTEDDISVARREYERLAGSATVMSDIPPSERVRDAWESWNVDRRHAAAARVEQVIRAEGSFRTASRSGVFAWR